MNDYLWLVKSKQGIMYEGTLNQCLGQCKCSVHVNYYLLLLTINNSTNIYWVLPVCQTLFLIRDITLNWQTKTPVMATNDRGLWLLLLQENNLRLSANICFYGTSAQCIYLINFRIMCCGVVVSSNNTMTNFALCALKKWRIPLSKESNPSSSTSQQDASA